MTAPVEFSKAVRLSMYERDGFRCVRCGRYSEDGAGLDAHHRRLRSQGGRGTLENGISLCGSGTTGCHGWVHAHPRLAYEAGWLVHSWDDPADVPWRTWADSPTAEAETGQERENPLDPTSSPDRHDSVASDRLSEWQWSGLA